MLIAAALAVLLLQLVGSVPAGALVCYKAHVLGIPDTNKHCVGPTMAKYQGAEFGRDESPSWRAGVWVGTPVAPSPDGEDPDER